MAKSLSLYFPATPSTGKINNEGKPKVELNYSTLDCAQCTTIKFVLRGRFKEF